MFVIGPDKKIKLILVYPMTTGRNFDEVLRVIDSLQLTAKHKVATPVNWKQGEKVIIAGSVSNDEAKETYPDGWEEPRPYIRIVPQPSCRSRSGNRAARPRRSSVLGPLQQALQDACGGAPDEVVVHDVGVGLERDPATLHARARPAGAEGIQRELEHGIHLRRRRVPAQARRDQADERMDHVVGHEGGHRRQLAEQAHLCACKPDLLLGLAQRRVRQVCVLRVPPAAGKGDLARMPTQIGAAPGEDGVRVPAVGRQEQRHQHCRGGLSCAVGYRLSIAVVIRRPCARARRAPRT